MSKSFCHFNAETFFGECYTFCGKQKDINKHQGNISSIHTYDTWECRTSKNVKKLETSLTKKDIPILSIRYFILSTCSILLASLYKIKYYKLYQLLSLLN